MVDGANDNGRSTIKGPTTFKTSVVVLSKMSGIIVVIFLSIASGQASPVASKILPRSPALSSSQADLLNEMTYWSALGPWKRAADPVSNCFSQHNTLSARKTILKFKILLTNK